VGGRVIHESHLGIVSLAPKVVRSAYPSKTMSYLEAGCKLLCVMETDTQMADMVRDESLGVACNAVPEEVAVAIRSEFELWKQSSYDRDQIQQFGRANFGKQYILGQWSRIVEGKEVEPAAQANAGMVLASETYSDCPG